MFIYRNELKQPLFCIISCVLKYIRSFKYFCKILKNYWVPIKAETNI